MYAYIFHDSDRYSCLLHEHPIYYYLPVIYCHFHPDIFRLSCQTAEKKKLSFILFRAEQKETCLCIAWLTARSPDFPRERGFFLYRNSFMSKTFHFGWAYCQTMPLNYFPSPFLWYFFCLILVWNFFFVIL